MLRYTEGATWNAVVVAISTPVSAIFWLIWDLNPNFVFSPHFNNASYCVLIGLAFMAPFIYLYHIEAHKLQLKEKEKLKNSLEYNINNYESTSSINNSDYPYQSGNIQFEQDDDANGVSLQDNNELPLPNTSQKPH